MNSNTKWRFLGTHVIFIGNLDFHGISRSRGKKPPKSISREHFFHPSEMEFMESSVTGDRRMQFSPGTPPTLESPKKSLFDPDGCPFTLFREKIGRDGKRFLRNFMNFAKKYFSGIKTERSWPTGSMRWPDPEIRPKIRKRFVD